MRSPSLDCSALRQRRESLGLSQSDLAERARLSRQTVNAIETGRSVPALDVALAIATAVAAPVEALFRRPARRSRPQIEATMIGPAPRLAGTRVALAQIGDRWLSYALTRDRLTQPADGVLRPGRRGRLPGQGNVQGQVQVDVDVHADLATVRDTVVLAGCAPALGLLAESLNRQPGAGRYLWLPLASSPALRALGEGQVHVAGVHLVDPESGQQNLAAVQNESGAGRRLLLTLARWEIGLVVPAGNPQRLRRLRQLFPPRAAKDRRRPALRIVGREPGSGVRCFLHGELIRAGLPADRVLARLPIAWGHLDVAQAVSLGAADVGIATRDAALAYGLDFVPLREERYDVALPSALADDRRLGRLLDTLSSAEFRRDLTALGYDARPCGSRVAELLAA
ncbi:MAG TPA: substrate-binding domain-containing protein [Pseudomonadota bacterium]|nr:substrate-binding domain-containing protein [Pseudomonadota bacterium]